MALLCTQKQRKQLFFDLVCKYREYKRTIITCTRTISRSLLSKFHEISIFFVSMGFFKFQPTTSSGSFWSKLPRYLNLSWNIERFIGLASTTQEEAIRTVEFKIEFKLKRRISLEDLKDEFEIIRLVMKFWQHCWLTQPHLSETFIIHTKRINLQPFCRVTSWAPKDNSAMTYLQKGVP